MLDQIERTADIAPQPEAAEETRERLVRQALAELRPYLQADGGDCELVAIEGCLVKIRMAGTCVGCQMASLTVSGIQERLAAKLGMPLRIMPVPKRI